MPLRTPSHNASRSLLMMPDVCFENQEKDEEVIVVVRQHPFTQLSWIVNVAILSVLVLLINILFSQYFGTNQQLVFNLFAIIFIFSYAWLNILLWYFTVGIITNKRILDLDFYNIIYREFTVTTIAHISETTTKIGGFFGSILNFGTVFVSTQGKEQNIEFENIPQPSTVVKIINELMSLNH